MDFHQLLVRDSNHLVINKKASSNATGVRAFFVSSIEDACLVSNKCSLLLFLKNGESKNTFLLSVLRI